MVGEIRELMNGYHCQRLSFVGDEVLLIIDCGNSEHISVIVLNKFILN